MDELGIDLGSWSTWLQNVGQQVITTKVQSDYNPQLKLAQMQLNAQNQYGQTYLEGQTNKAAATVGGIPTSWLLIGGAIALVMVLKD